MKIVKINRLKIVIFQPSKIAVYCMGVFSLWLNTIFSGRLVAV